MKICLPTENWNDVFGFLPRPQLGELVSLIADWYFASKAQYYLHECGQITLGYLAIEPSATGSGPVIVKEKGRELPLADVPMPKNVQNFKQIFIRYCDESVLRFLEEFLPKSLFANANLKLTQYSRSISPLILLEFENLMLVFRSSINSFDLSDNMQHIFKANEDEQLVKQVLTSTRFLKASYYTQYNDWYGKWLQTPRQDGKPRVLNLGPNGCVLPDTSFIDYIKKDFLSAKQAISFKINLKDFGDACRDVQPFCLDNLHTKEKLVMKKRFGDVSISRHPTDENVEWKWLEMSEYEKDHEHERCNITICLKWRY